MLDDGARVLGEVPAAHDVPDAEPLVLAPDARERLARHLWVADGGSGELWDGVAADVARAYSDLTPAETKLAQESFRGKYLAYADEILAVIAGKEG